jgi:hypothetical protein
MLLSHPHQSLKQDKIVKYIILQYSSFSNLIFILAKPQKGQTKLNKISLISNLKAVDTLQPIYFIDLTSSGMNSSNVFGE